MGKYLLAIWQCRYFWLSLVRMDLRTRYRRSVLGIGWSLLHPIAMTAIICIVFPRFLKEINIHEYAPFVLAGLACWNYILFVTLQGCQCFYQGEMYIRQFPAPMAIFPLRTALGGTIHFLIALAVVIGVAWIFQGAVNPLALLSLIPVVVLLFVFVWSLAVLAGIANLFFNDTQHLCEIFFQLLFYATPIMYGAEMLAGSRLGKVIQLNPFGIFMSLIREPILKQRIAPWSSYVWACLIVIVFVTAASFFLARLQRKLIFRL
jgi:homopolymeric O-antigen transport system permease protein